MTEKIDHLFDEMMDELRGAEKYADCAAKSDNIESKKMFVEMSKQELTHYHNLHAICQAEVTSGVGDPEGKTILKYLTGKFKDWEERILFKLNQIK